MVLVSPSAGAGGGGGEEASPAVSAALAPMAPLPTSPGVPLKPSDAAQTDSEDGVTSAAKSDSESVPRSLLPGLPATLTELSLRGSDLAVLPADIGLCVNLTKLDVGNNPLTDFPAGLVACTNLGIVFASNCPNMTRIPIVLGSMPSVTRLGLRSNAIDVVDADAIPPAVQHLILTDNKIAELDVSVFHRLTSVRKLMLSHNLLTSLPDDGVPALSNLELLRLANNKLTALPTALLTLPKLSWLAVSGNPLPGMAPPPMTVPVVNDAVVLDREAGALGKGASGTVWAGTWDGKQVAVKEFNAVTSDGRAEEEVALYGAVGSGNPHVAACVAVMDGASGGPLGVVMNRLPDGLRDLALPPTIVEVIEDRYAEGETFGSGFVKMVVAGMSQALAFLHGDLHIAHGDVYAHNMLVDDSHCFLLDFGAAYCYGAAGGSESGGLVGDLVEKLEVRAFGVLVKELTARMVVSPDDGGLKRRLEDLAEECLVTEVSSRPTFTSIRDGLATLLEG